MSLRLPGYYRLYKLVGRGRARYHGLRLLRILGRRYLLVKLDTNWLCNLRCRMCFFSDMKRLKIEPIGPMTEELFGKIANDIFGKTRMLFVGCGAEPLASPLFTTYARIVGDHRIPFVALVTNGQLLNEGVASSIMENRFNQLIISVCGASQDTYEYLHVGAKFEKLRDNLRMVQRLKARSGSPLDLRFNFTMMRRNADELGGLIELAAEHGVSAIRVRSLGHWGGTLDYGKEMMPHADYRERVRGVEEAARKANVELLYEGMYEHGGDRQKGTRFEPYECVDPFYQVIIRGDGKMRYCTFWPFEHGDLSVQTYKEIEKSAAMRKARHLLVNKPQESCLTKCRGKFVGL